MTEFLAFIVILVVIGFISYVVTSLFEFVVETPKQLKRIADALEWRNKNGK